MFLSGPKKQCKSMFDKKRIITTIVLLAAIILVITCGIVGEVTKDPDTGDINPIFPILVLVGVVIEYCAYFWYSLSYIPFGR
jgi:hypothetical protein